jgi:hypothetical protein
VVQLCCERLSNKRGVKAARLFPDNLFSQYKNIFIHKNVHKHKHKKLTIQERGATSSAVGRSLGVLSPTFNNTVGDARVPEEDFEEIAN